MLDWTNRYAWAWQTTDKGWEIDIPVSGAVKEDFSVSLTDDTLKVSFEGNKFIGAFKQQWTLPKNIVAKNISAKCVAGVLTLTVEKPNNYEQTIKVEE